MPNAPQRQNRDGLEYFETDYLDLTNVRAFLYNGCTLGLTTDKDDLICGALLVALPDLDGELEFI